MAEIDKRISDGYIRRVKGNSYMEDLKSGNAIAGIVWSGDIFILRAETENDNWQFVIPESGGTLWSDNMMVPITSRHRNNAMTLMDYYYQPEVAAEVAAYVNYVCPVRVPRPRWRRSTRSSRRARSSSPSESYIKDDNIMGFRASAPGGPGLRRRVGKGGGQLMSVFSSRREGRQGFPRGQGRPAASTAVTKVFGDFTAVDDLALDVPARLVLRPARPVRVRQDDDAAHGRRSRAADPRADPHRRHRPHRVAPYERPVNTVFQSYALFPHLTILDNVAFGPKRRGASPTP